MTSTQSELEYEQQSKLHPPMTATLAPKPWDLSHVLDLVNNLSLAQPPRDDGGEKGGNHEAHHHGSIAAQDFVPSPAALGNFDNVFQYFATPVKQELAAPAVQSPQRTADHYFTTKTDYASDGAAQTKPESSVKGNVRWQHLSETEDLATGTASDSSVMPESPTLTKSQRKKRNRRERKAQQTAQAEAKKSKHSVAAVSESEADMVQRRNPAKRASSHNVVATPVKQHNLRPRDSAGRTVTESTPQSLSEAVKLATERLELAKKANGNALKENSTVASPAPANAHGKTPLPAAKTTSPSLTKRNTNRIPATTTKVQNTTTPQKGKSSTAGTLRFTPATVGPDMQINTPSSQPIPPTEPTQTATLHPLVNQIRPMIVRSGEDKDWALLMKLIGDFYHDRKHLVSPMNLTTHNNHPNGIHVFVDASNIFIGFKDQLKRARGIPAYVQVPNVDLSFDALALLMERRRPVAKRVLVGSTPMLPAFEKAKEVGYECSILEKVYKARELTERQIYFKEHDRFGVPKRAKAPPANTVATINGAGSGSGSETSTPQYAPARMIEQGVDEILHLKILESVVDTEKPGTMVLATGDAAQAEYSQGFMAMAERALKKGWIVELVSWSKNISAMYTRKEWRDAWGERFKIVLLDNYAEELLDM